MKEDKKALRRRIADVCDGLTDEYIRFSDRGIFENFFKLPEYASAGKVFIYYSAFKEPDTKSIIKKMLEDGKKVFIPYIMGKGIMEAREITGTEKLEKGVLGIPEVPESSMKAEPEELDLIVVPGVAFDLSGSRLGRGGGYYDRYLTASKAVRTGLSREACVVDIIPTESHDMKMDYVITENGIKKSEAR